MSHADVTGLQLYYRDHGSGGGAPLILLHGGLAAGEMFAAILPALAAGRRVITVDLPGHGHTADPGKPLRFEWMAGTIAALITHLGLTQADLMGYSLGGEVAIRTAIQHPGLVRRLVVVSSPCRRDGWYPESLAGMEHLGPDLAEQLRHSPPGELYAQVAPRPEDWPLLLGRSGELLSRDFDWTAEISQITAQVMLVYADADAIRPAHIVEFYALLGGGLRDAGWDGAARPGTRLAILPGLTHYDIAGSAAVPAAVIPFLDAPVRQPA